jgi:hypothetical protein
MSSSERRPPGSAGAPLIRSGPPSSRHAAERFVSAPPASRKGGGREFGARPVLSGLPHPATPSAETIVHQGAGDLVASLGNSVVVLLEHSFTTLAASAIGSEMSRIVGRYGRVNYVSLISSGKLRQQHGARTAMANVVRRYTKSITGAAIVCEGTGFRPTVVRSAITGIHVASLASHPLRVFSTLEPALAWLLEQQPERDLDIAALGRSVGELRARLAVASNSAFSSASG